MLLWTKSFVPYILEDNSFLYKTIGAILSAESIRQNSMGDNVKDNLSKYLILKAEKLSSAVYLVTDILSDQEPLKWKLRQQTLDWLLTSRSVFKSGVSTISPAGIGQVLTACGDIISLLDLGYGGGTVSRMNFEILREEFVGIQNTIEEKMGRLYASTLVTDPTLEEMKQSLGSNLLPIDQTLSLLREKALMPTPVFSRSGSNSSNWSESSRPSSASRGLTNVAVKEVKEISRGDIKDRNQEGLKDNKKNKRQEQILATLKNKGWVSINDIAKAVPGYSVKTVQRELSELVDRGILKKQGERRWSRYLLG